MDEANIGFNPDTYSSYVGTYYNLGFYPALLLVAPFMGSFNRKVVIGLSSVIWGAAMLYQGHVTRIEELYAMSTIQGFFAATVEQVAYNIVGDFFEPRYRMRAYISFTMITLLHYPIIFLIPELIHQVKWRQAWNLIGGISMGAGLMMLITVQGPGKSVVIKNNNSSNESI